MTQARTFLLIGTISAALILAGCNPGRNDSAPEPKTAADIKTFIMQSYNTSESKRLENLQNDLNGALPSGVAPIQFLDYDKIATWFSINEGPATLEAAIGDYLTAKTGRTYDPSTLSLL